jgi:hypothetical protein
MFKFSNKHFDLIEKYKKLHLEGTSKLPPNETFAGYSLEKWIYEIKNIIAQNKYKSLLDYGCGKALLYHNNLSIENKRFNNICDFWQIQDYALYDPAVEKYSKHPEEKKDIVICTDVIEHLNPQDTKLVLEDIFNHAEKHVFISIDINPASKFFENGENIHTCLKSKEEWEKIFRDLQDKFSKVRQDIRIK